MITVEHMITTVTDNQSLLILGRSFPGTEVHFGWLEELKYVSFEYLNEICMSGFVRNDVLIFSTPKNLAVPPKKSLKNTKILNLTSF